MKVHLGKYKNNGKDRIQRVEIHGYDTWNLNNDLALIIHPALVKFREHLGGAPNTDDEDVPEELRSTAAKPKEHEYDTDDLHFKRWEWIVDEMIFAFEKISTWDDENMTKFSSGEHDIYFEEITEGNLAGKGYSEMKKGPNDTWELDREAWGAFQARINNGLRLFGKYYRCLWN